MAPLIRSVYGAGGTFFRPDASESHEKHAAILAVPFLQGKNPLIYRNNYIKESLIYSVIRADGIFLRPAASQKPRNSAAIPSVLFLAGRKNLLVIAKTALNQWFLKSVVPYE